MPVHSETRKLPYSAEQMYDLVADISAYPQFLPWCSAARIRLRATEGERETVEADLVVSLKFFERVLPVGSSCGARPRKSIPNILKGLSNT